MSRFVAGIGRKLLQNIAASDIISFLQNILILIFTYETSNMLLTWHSTPAITLGVNTVAADNSKIAVSHWPDYRVYVTYMPSQLSSPIQPCTETCRVRNTKFPFCLKHARTQTNSNAAYNIIIFECSTHRDPWRQAVRRMAVQLWLGHAHLNHLGQAGTLSSVWVCYGGDWHSFFIDWSTFIAVLSCHDDHRLKTFNRDGEAWNQTCNPG